MSIQKAYSRMAGRIPEQTQDEVDQENTEKVLAESELKRWLDLPKTKELIIFLGKRELELLDNARNCSRVKLGNENTDKNLQKSIAYREVIEFLTQNKLPERE